LKVQLGNYEFDSDKNNRLNGERIVGFKGLEQKQCITTGNYPPLIFYELWMDVDHSRAIEIHQIPMGEQNYE
jgi:hypothetical protein